MSAAPSVTEAKESAVERAPRPDSDKAQLAARHNERAGVRAGCSSRVSERRTKRAVNPQGLRLCWPVNPADVAQRTLDMSSSAATA